MSLPVSFHKHPFLLLALLSLNSAFAAEELCVVGKRVLVTPGDHPATVLGASGASCRLHYEDGAFPDGWTYKFSLKATGSGGNAATPSANPPAAASHPAQELCVAGKRVLVTPGDHPATVLGASAASCQLHYEDGAFPDGWTYKFNLKAIGPGADPSTAANGLRLGRYNITVGSSSAFDGYFVLTSAQDYELFLPGGTGGGRGQYTFDPAGSRIRWISGPLTDPRWDGTQQVESTGAMVKIRIGARTVATNAGR